MCISFDVVSLSFHFASLSLFVSCYSLPIPSPADSTPHRNPCQKTYRTVVRVNSVVLPLCRPRRFNKTTALMMTKLSWVAQYWFRSMGGASGAGFGPALAGNLARTDQHPVPNCPGVRPGQFGTDFLSVRHILSAFRSNFGSSSSVAARPPMPPCGGEGRGQGKGWPKAARQGAAGGQFWVCRGPHSCGWRSNPGGTN